MTVSNAFSRPDQLSAELRERVLAAAEEVGYVGPDPAARALARGTAGAVGVLLTDSLRYAFTDDVATGFLGAVVDELAPTGLALTLLTSTERGDAVPARDIAIDGAIVYSCRPQSTARDWLEGAGIDVDDPVGEPVPHPQRERMLGSLEVLRRAGIESPVEHARSNSDDAAEQAARAMLSTADERPTAVLCFSDVLALGVIRAAHHLGLTVPGDLSVVGFDDSPVASRHDPGITTVRQDVAAKGRLAAAALTAAIARRRAGEPAEAPHHLLPTELIVRESTGPAPQDR
jgi:DNA-binding LacI/PurR family transcriptional regulator